MPHRKKKRMFWFGYQVGQKIKKGEYNEKKQQESSIR